MKISSYIKIPVFAVLLLIAFELENMSRFIYETMEKCGMDDILEYLGTIK